MEMAEKMLGRPASTTRDILRRSNFVSPSATSFSRSTFNRESRGEEGRRRGGISGLLAERLVDEKGSARRSRRRVFTGSQGERMHFSRSSEVLYFHSGSVSVHTDSHTDLERYVGCLPGAIYGNMREREKEGESVSGVSLVGMLSAACSPQAKLSFFWYGE